MNKMLKKGLSLMMFLVLFESSLGYTTIKSSDPPSSSIPLSVSPNITLFGPHAGRATWEFNNASGCEMANLTTTGDGLVLAPDTGSYLNIQELRLYSSCQHGADLAIAVNSSRGIIATWTESNQGIDLHAQIIDPTGEISHQEIVVCEDSDYQFKPAISVNSRDEFVIVWEEINTSSWMSDIFAQRFDSEGSKLGGQIPICTAFGNQSSPSITVNSKDLYVVTWEDARGSNSDIYARFLNSDGTFSGDEISACTAESNQCNPVIAMNSMDGFVVAWVDQRDGPGQIYRQRYGSDGTKVGTDAPVAGAFAEQNLPEIAAFPNGSIVITWYESVSAKHDVYMQIVDSTGKVQGERIPLCSGIQYQSLPSSGPSVSIDGIGNIVVAWEDDGLAHCRRLNARGESLSEKILISSTSDASFSPVSVLIENETSLVAWMDSQGQPYAALLRPGLFDNGYIEIPDFAPQHLFSWKEYWLQRDFGNKDVEMIRVLNSIDGGLIWNETPTNRSLSDISTATGKVRLRVEINTTFPIISPVIYNISVWFNLNQAPTISSILPIEISDIPKRQRVNLTGIAYDPDNDIIKFHWDQVEGPMIEIKDQDSSDAWFVTGDAGNYSFRLTVVDEYERTISSPLRVIVVNHPPVASVQLTGIPYERIPCYINGNVNDVDGDELICTWSLISAPPFTTMLQPTLTDIILQSPTPGECKLSLTVVDEEGAAFSDILVFNFVGHSPTARLSVMQDSLHAGKPIVFDASNSTDEDGDSLNYRFEYGDGNVTDWILSPISIHSYASAGCFSAKLEVKDTDGDISRPAYLQLEIQPPNTPPKASFECAEGNLSVPHFFQSTSSDEDGFIVKYEWNLGDGTTSSQRDLTHQYKVGGNHTIQLTVTDDDGDASTFRMVLNVNRPPILRNINPPSEYRLKLGESITLFVDAVDPDGDRLQYSWSIDGKAAMAENGTLFFKAQAEGNDDISVQVTDSRGEYITFTWHIQTVAVRKSMILPLSTILLFVVILLVVIICVLVSLSMRYKFNKK